MVLLFRFNRNRIYVLQIQQNCNNANIANNVAFIEDTNYWEINLQHTVTRWDSLISIYCRLKASQRYTNLVI